MSSIPEPATPGADQPAEASAPDPLADPASRVAPTQGGAMPAAYGLATVDPNAKSKLAAALLAFFFGMFGAHRFYLGYTKRGLIMLLVTIVGGILTLGLAAVAMQFWSWYEAIMYLTGNPKYTTDAASRPLRN